MSPHGCFSPCFLQFPWELLFLLWCLSTQHAFIVFFWLLCPSFPSFKAQLNPTPNSSFMNSSHPSLCPYSMGAPFFSPYETPCCLLGVAWTLLLPASLFRFSPAAAAPMPDAWPFSWAYPASVYSLSVIFLQTVSCLIQYLLSMALLGFLEKANWSLSCDPRSLGTFLLQLWSHSWTVMYIMSVHLPWTDWGFELCIVYCFGIPGFQLRELGNSSCIISLHSLLLASFMRDGMTRILSALQKLWLISQEKS